MTAVTVRAPRLEAEPLRAVRSRGRHSAIVGVGTHVPEDVLTNDDLEKMMDTSDEWIRERTGIRSRHVAPPGTSTVELSTRAAEAALRSAGVEASDVDLILVASSSPDAPFPSMACRVQDRLGAERATAFDILAACTGFIYELSVGDSFIATGRADTVLVVGGEVLSRLVDWKDRSVSVLLGDAAGAVVLRPADDGAGFLSWCLGSDGRGWDLLHYGERADVGAYAARDTEAYFRMNGRETFKFATDVFVRQAHAALAAADMTTRDLDLFVPHQANRRIIENAARRLGLPPERVVINIERYGNTSTASIPLALEEALADGRVHAGSRVLLASFGSGLTWGACVLEWV